MLVAQHWQATELAAQHGNSGGRLGHGDALILHFQTEGSRRVCFQLWYLLISDDDCGYVPLNKMFS